MKGETLVWHVDSFISRSGPLSCAYFDCPRQGKQGSVKDTSFHDDTSRARTVFEGKKVKAKDNVRTVAPAAVSLTPQKPNTLEFAGEIEFSSLRGLHSSTPIEDSA